MKTNTSEQEKTNRREWSPRKGTNRFRHRDTLIHTLGCPIKTQNWRHNIYAKDLQDENK